LDSANSLIIIDIFRSLVDNSNTIIAITHDEDFAKKTDRTIEMKDGAILNH
jgi:lipoprotein-releasing system ATP-binding protein